MTKSTVTADPMPTFVSAVVKATGKIRRIPSAWLDHPVLGAAHKLTPSTRKALEQEAETGHQVEDPALTNAIGTGTGGGDAAAPETAPSGDRAAARKTTARRAGTTNTTRRAGTTKEA